MILYFKIIIITIVIYIKSYCKTNHKSVYILKKKNEKNKTLLLEFKFSQACNWYLSLQRHLVTRERNSEETIKVYLYHKLT